MDKKTTTGSKIAEIAGKIVALLEPLNSEDRLKTVNASLTMLGEFSIGEGGSPADPGAGGGAKAQRTKHDQMSGALSSAATRWMKQNDLTAAQLEQVLDITDAGIAVIVSEVPGKGKKEQSHNAYVLQGLVAFLASGQASFSDKDARKVCEELGCYDNTNHAKFMSDKGNLLAGSKDAGWRLTAPGLRRGAELIKQLTKGE